MGTFNRLAAAGYAIRWALGNNPVFPVYANTPGAGNNDCTNFVSQVMLAGGWTVVPGGKRDPTAWWSSPDESSWTWAAANNFGDFIKRSHRASNCTRDELDLGDIVQDIHPGNDVPHHTMVVSQKLGTKIYLSYHSRNTRNILLDFVEEKQAQIQARVGDRWEGVKYVYWKMADSFPEFTAMTSRIFSSPSDIITSIPVSFDGTLDGPPGKRPITRFDSSLVTVPGDVLFDFDKDVVKPGAERELAKVVPIIQSHLSSGLKGSYVMISGHTDSIPGKTQDYNQELSERRARAVARWLVERKFLSPEQVRTQGFGSSRPNAPNNDATGRARNRRVEFQVMKI
jgi:outer membrane protein OmpA-like peptidoglycan-associated protein